MEHETDRGSRLAGWRYFPLAVASSVLLTASFPPFDLVVMAWLGLAPLLYALRRASASAAAGLGFLFGFLFSVSSLYWGIHILSWPQFLLMAVLIAVFYSVFGILYRRISRRAGLCVYIAAPSLWIVLEYLRANLSFLAWPFLLMGYTQYRFLPVIQIADLAGVYGISFLMVLVNQYLSELPEFVVPTLGGKIQGARAVGRKIAWLPGSLLILLTLGGALSYGWYRMASTESRRHIRVAIVQANAIVRDNMPLGEQFGVLEAYGRLSKEAARSRPDLILWPSTSIPAPITSRLVRIAVPRIARENGAHLLVGGAGHEKDRPRREGDTPYSNSEFLFSPGGFLEAQYNKMRLLPFNEYLPLQGKFRWPGWVTRLSGSFIPGTEYTIFRVGEGRFGAPICWENMFPRLFSRFVRDGANFMVIVTNEAFAGDTPEPYHSLAVNVFRAVENRVAVARAAVTGISCFIEPDGAIVQRIQNRDGKDLYVSGWQVRDLSLADQRTFYTAYGDLFVYGAFGVGALILLRTRGAARRELFSGNELG